MYYQHFHLTPDWQSLEEYFQRLTKQGSAINLGTYVGAAQVRHMVIGTADRAPTADELKQMEIMVDDAMSDGAMGLSSALIYSPGSYAKTDELIALAKVAAKKGGIYATHMRNESDAEVDALNEAFQIGREAGIPVEIFHLKCAGKQNWGKMPQVIAAIEQARATGVDVTADQYPYTGAATSLGAVIPARYHAGGPDAFVKRLKDPKIRAQIRKEIMAPSTSFENLWLGAGGADGVLVISVLNPELRKYEGKTVAQIAKMDNKEPLDALMDLVIADRDNVGAVYFLMSEADVKLAMQQPWVSVGTDYGAISPTGPLGESKSHPRAYGSFARILGKYVRDEHTLRMEDAIRKFTSLPAQREKLDHRGLLRTDYFADITIFDPEKVRDMATFDDPNKPSVGFEYVFVNGVLALEHDKVTGQMGGHPLRGPGYMFPRLHSRRPAAAWKVAGSDNRRGRLACASHQGHADRCRRRRHRYSELQTRWPLPDHPGEALQRLFAASRAHGLRKSATLRRRLQRVEFAVVQLCDGAKQVAQQWQARLSSRTQAQVVSHSYTFVIALYVCHPDRGLQSERRDLRFSIVCAHLSWNLIPVSKGKRQTADPSAALRFGRDDKGSRCHPERTRAASARRSRRIPIVARRMPPYGRRSQRAPRSAETTLRLQEVVPPFKPIATSFLYWQCSLSVTSDSGSV